MDPGEVASENADVDPSLTELTEEITRRLQSGESLEADTIANQHPDWGGILDELLPTLQELVNLGNSMRRGQCLESNPFRTTL